MVDDDDEGGMRVNEREMWRLRKGSLSLICEGFQSEAY